MGRGPSKPMVDQPLAVHPTLLTDALDDDRVSVVNKVLEVWNDRTYDELVTSAERKYVASLATPHVLAACGIAYRRRRALPPRSIRPFVPMLLSLPVSWAGATYYGTISGHGRELCRRFEHRRLAWNRLRVRWEAYRPGDLYRPDLSVEMQREIDADHDLFKQTEHEKKLRKAEREREQAKTA